MIVLSGLDGSGKSTQALRLAERLHAEGLRARAVWNRWNPTVSAPFIRLAKRALSTQGKVRENDYEEFREAKRREMRSGWKRNLWQFMVWTEYACQVHWRTLFLRLSGVVVISDRYVYDTLIDVAINFSCPPEALAGLMSHRLLALFPKPALALFIDIDPTIGAARKADGTPPAYLADRRVYYASLAHMLAAPIVEGGASVDEVSQRIWELTAEWRGAMTGRDAGAGRQER
jgi:thymidylate kinase